MLFEFSTIVKLVVMKIGVKIFVEIHFTLRNKRQKLVYEKKKKKKEKSRYKRYNVSMKR